MREELLANGESLETREVVVVPGWELVVTWTLLLGKLLVPPLHQTTPDTLNPFFHFVGLGPCTPTLGCTRNSVFAQSEFWLNANIDVLSSDQITCEPSSFFRHWQKHTYRFAGDQLMWDELDARAS